MAGVFKYAQCMRVSQSCSSDLGNDVFVAAIVQIGEGDAVSFMPVAGAR
jgi:hypothetical protein